jgi:DNA helicase-2/ATP-dependent DNA helicase PcrA
MNSHPPHLPKIDNEGIEWACRVLKLPPTAFSGENGDDPRLGVIRSLGSLDVEACPGSGKTTLLVGKLAILARHWTERCRGICVLSHTNVARREIETKLGSTPEGMRLLTYPHFIGTIHGFVNEFLALPWLRSKPYPTKVIDDNICLQRRWFKLPWQTRSGLETNKHTEQALRMTATDFSVNDLHWGKGGILRADSPTYQEIQRACQECCEEGYFCHDEMFLWATELLDQAPWIRKALRERFPLLFIDEMQDTKENQSVLLFRLFMEGESPVIRQRFGDSNQAIYGDSNQTERGASADPFPDLALKRDIPNSHRFGQQIADLADPLGVVPQKLIGLGPRRDEISADTDSKHTIFLFDDRTIGHVLPSYAAYLIELFSERELRDGMFTAVGARHTPAEGKQVPRYVAHYWSEYDHELTALEPRPKTFLQYLAAGRALARTSGEAHHVVEKIADGVLRLAAILNRNAEFSLRKRRHRYVRELLACQPDVDRNYVEIVSVLAVGPRDAIPSEWSEVWAPRVKAVADALSGTTGNSDEAALFLSGQPATAGGTQPSSPARRDNVFRYPPVGTKVEVRVGSIHSVKGETHTATLVLDTFYIKHHLTMLKPWLLGKKAGGGSENDTLLSRLRQHYVAMTRPSHLVCVAMREDCLSNGDVAAFKNRGWRVARVNAEVPEWL